MPSTGGSDVEATVDRGCQRPGLRRIRRAGRVCSAVVRPVRRHGFARHRTGDTVDGRIPGIGQAFSPGKRTVDVHGRLGKLSTIGGPIGPAATPMGHRGAGAQALPQAVALVRLASRCRLARSRLGRGSRAFAIEASFRRRGQGCSAVGLGGSFRPLAGFQAGNDYRRTCRGALLRF